MMNIFILSEEEHSYLMSNLPDDILNTFVKLNYTLQKRKFHLHIDDELANEIRDWAINRQLVAGLVAPKDNPDGYEFNAEGILLDNLINIFFTG